MKWFSNLKIRVKLISGFLLVAIIAGVVGYIGITNIGRLDTSEKELYQNITVPVENIGTLAATFHRMRVILRDAILADTEDQRKTEADKIAVRKSEMDQATEARLGTMKFLSPFCAVVLWSAVAFDTALALAP